MSEATICQACGSPLFRRPADSWLIEHGGPATYCANAECPECFAIPTQSAVRHPWMILTISAVSFFAMVGLYNTVRWLLAHAL